MRLQNKVALITGASKGIGAAQALMFAKEGAKIGVADILEEDGQKLASQVIENGGEAIFIKLDVTSDPDWQYAINSIDKQFGKLNVLINNAAIYMRGIVEETTPEEWDLIMDINAKGPFLGTRAAIPAMRKSGGGSIVNIASFNSLVGTSTSSAYNASKAAVRLLTKSTAVQYAKESIRANSIHPGPIQTTMFTSGFPDPESIEQRRASVPLGRIGTVSDVAYGSLFLASDESSYVTGSDLVIDGGWTAQ